MSNRTALFGGVAYAALAVYMESDPVFVKYLFAFACSLVWGVVCGLMRWK